MVPLKKIRLVTSFEFQKFGYLFLGSQYLVNPLAIEIDYLEYPACAADALARCGKMAGD